MMSVPVLLSGCSTGVFFADDNLEGHVGIVSVERVGSVAEVIDLESGKAPQLLVEDQTVSETPIAATQGEAVVYIGPEPAAEATPESLTVAGGGKSSLSVD